MMPKPNSRTALISALLAVGIASMVTACSSSPAPIAAHGSITVDYTLPFGGGTGDDLSDGDQVVVVNSAGTVMGTGTLSTAGGKSLGGAGFEDIFGFMVKVPGGLPRCGIQIDGTSHGTVWESVQQMKSGPALTLDETTNGN
jgi:hypothetical protein